MFNIERIQSFLDGYDYDEVSEKMIGTSCKRSCWGFLTTAIARLRCSRPPGIGGFKPFDRALRGRASHHPHIAGSGSDRQALASRVHIAFCSTSLT